MLKLLFIVLAALICLALIVCIHDLNHIKVVHYSIKDQKVKKNIRFAILADLHNHTFKEDNQELIHAIVRENPDAILIAGDLATRGRIDYFHGAVSLLEGLAGRYPIYYAPGNHESKLEQCTYKFGDSFKLYLKELTRLDVHLMKNEKVYLEDENIAVYGLELPLETFSHFNHVQCPKNLIPDLLGKPKEEEFNLLIAHNPEHFDRYLSWGSDLTISGHQHGGIVRLPFVGGIVSTAGLLFPEYDGGLFSKEKGKMIISRGLGTHTIPVRFNNPCELVILDLKKGM